MYLYFIGLAIIYRKDSIHSIVRFIPNLTNYRWSFLSRLLALSTHNYFAQLPPHACEHVGSNTNFGRLSE
jgi:hypothetical protein